MNGKERSFRKHTDVHWMAKITVANLPMPMSVDQRENA